MNDDEVDQLMQDYVEAGVLIPDGESFRIGPNCQTLAPDLYKMIQQETDEALLTLVELGLVELFIDGEGEWLFSLTEEGRQIIENMGA